MRKTAETDRRRLRGQRAHLAGMAAEHQIARDYARRGGRIVNQRWRGRGGEIDLVLRDDTGLVFVEVKHSRNFDDALAHVSPRQIRRLYDAAEEYVAGEPLGSLTDIRFDIALVNGQGEYKILENAFA